MIEPKKSGRRKAGVRGYTRLHTRHYVALASKHKLHPHFHHVITFTNGHNLHDRIYSSKMLKQGFMSVHVPLIPTTVVVSRGANPVVGSRVFGSSVPVVIGLHPDVVSLPGLINLGTARTESLYVALQALITQSSPELLAASSGGGAHLRDTESNPDQALRLLDLLHTGVNDIGVNASVAILSDTETALRDASSPESLFGEGSEGLLFHRIVMDRQAETCKDAGEHILRLMRSILKEQDDIYTGGHFHGQRLDDRLFLYTPCTIPLLNINTARTRDTRESVFLHTAMLADAFGTRGKAEPTAPDDAQVCSVAMDVIRDAALKAYIVIAGSRTRNKMDVNELRYVRECYMAILGALWLSSSILDELFIEATEVMHGNQLDPLSMYGVYHSAAIMYNMVWRNRKGLYAVPKTYSDTLEMNYLLTPEGYAYMSGAIIEIFQPFADMVNLGGTTIVVAPKAKAKSKATR